VNVDVDTLTAGTAAFYITVWLRLYHRSTL